MGSGVVALRRTQVKLGATSAIVGALLGFVVNLMHGDLPADPEAALTRVAATAGWGLLHLGIMASAMLILGGLVGLSQVADGPYAQALARLSVVVALPGAAVLLVGIAIDGFATKALADLWATAPAPERATAFRMALAVDDIQTALFHTWAALFIGFPFLLLNQRHVGIFTRPRSRGCGSHLGFGLGVSGLLAGGGFPRWLGMVALIGGTGAAFMGVAGFLHLPVPGVLFNVCAFLVTLWSLAAGVFIWRAPARPGVVLLEGAAAV